MIPRGYFGGESAEGFVFSAYPRQLTTLAERLQRRGYATTIVTSNPLYLDSGLYKDGQDIVVSMDNSPGRVVNQATFGLMENASRERPLFLLVHYMEAHHWHPWYYRRLHGEEEGKLNAAWVRESYEAAVGDLGQRLGELLDGWSRREGSEDSLIVFFPITANTLWSIGARASGTATA